MKNLIKTFFLIMLCLITTSESAEAKNTRFIQVSDVHFSDNEQCKARFLTAIKDINSVPHVDFVVFTGDVLERAEQKDLVAFLKMSKKLNTPFYVLIGNHDVFRTNGLDKEEFMHTVKRYAGPYHPNKSNYIFKKNKIVFLVVDGAKEVIPSSSGYFKKSTLRWLDRQLKKHANQNVVILQHFPIVTPDDIASNHITHNSEEYFKILEKYNNVIAIISGHLHSNSEVMNKNIYHINTPALVQNPMLYKIIDIEDSKSKDKRRQIYTQLRKVEN